MNESLPTIAKLSPTLAGALRRFVAPLTEPALTPSGASEQAISLLLGCEAAFAFAVAHGALNELDYPRPEGQSFNPRPARVALILLSDGELQKAPRDSVKACSAILYVLQAAFVTSVMKLKGAGDRMVLPPQFDPTPKSDLRELDPRALALAAAICEPMDSENGLSAASPTPLDVRDDGLAANEKLLRAALSLDRARHRHLAKGETAESWRRFLREVLEAAEQVAQVGPRLADLLRTWHRRALMRTTFVAPGANPGGEDSEEKDPNDHPRRRRSKPSDNARKNRGGRTRRARSSGSRHS